MPKLTIIVEDSEVFVQNFQAFGAIRRAKENVMTDAAREMLESEAMRYAVDLAADIVAVE